MDLILFPAYEVPSTRFQYRPERSAPPVTAERFAGWPEHMRREFALIAREAGHDDATLRDRTGIAPAALARARDGAGFHTLSFSDARAADDDGRGGNA